MEVCNFPLCKLSEKERKLTQAATERLDIVKECGEAREDLEGDIDPSYYLKQVSIGYGSPVTPWSLHGPTTGWDRCPNGLRDCAKSRKLD